MIILAEKPSAARNFSKALGGMSGTFDGQDFEIVALRGHVLELLEPAQQVAPELAEFYGKWSLETLPWNVDEIAFEKGINTKGDGYSEILDNLREHLEGADEVAIATDDDPSGEGELLAWEALDWVGWSGKTTRMYFVDEAPASIQKAFRERRALPSMEQDGDYAKALVRQKWDFLSMQFTRLASGVARRHGFYTEVRQGRLKSVMVKLVGDQLAAYEGYVKKPFYEARFKDENGNVFARKAEDVEDIRFASAEDVDLSALHESTVAVDSRTKKHTAPGKMLDLAGMTAILAKQGYKPDAVINTYQRMYEDQVVSYPRTEDKQITPEQFAELLPLADKIAGVVGVDAKVLTHREARSSHVKEGGSHGANRPGPRVPASLEALSGYGKEAAAIYELLAKNYLAMLAEDYEYELVKGHVADFPEYVGETKVPVSAGFKAVFDAEAEVADDVDGGNSAEFGTTVAPYVFEGANKRPQKPTMKWLNKRLEKYNVGTGATRSGTVAEITKEDKRALMEEHKGALTLAPCGEVSYALLDGCEIASPETTERLFEAMERVGCFEEDPDAVLATATEMVVHDKQAMLANEAALASLAVVAGEPVGACPLCGQPVVKKKSGFYSCSTNRSEKQEDGTWKQVAGCGFKLFGFCGKDFTAKQAANLLAGKKVALKGCISKAGNAFDCKVSLGSDGKINAEFPPKSAAKPKAKKAAARRTSAARRVGRRR